MLNTQCKRNEDSKLRERIYEYVTSKDGDGREFVSCKHCGNLRVSLIKKDRIIYE